MCQKKKELLERKIGGQTSKIGAALNNRHHEASVYLSCYTYIHDMSKVIYTVHFEKGGGVRKIQYTVYACKNTENYGPPLSTSAISNAFYAFLIIACQLTSFPFGGFFTYQFFFFDVRLQWNKCWYSLSIIP